jgi:hypothetical protein
VTTEVGWKVSIESLMPVTATMIASRVKFDLS